MKLLYLLYKRLIILLTGAFSVILFIHSLFSTTLVYTYGEYYTEDENTALAAFAILAVVLVCTGVKLLIKKGWFKRFFSDSKGDLDKQGAFDGQTHSEKGSVTGKMINPSAISNILIVLIFLGVLWFVLGVRLSPRGDQQLICSGAYGLHKYDFSLFGDKGYYGYWPFQSRITVFLWGFFTIFGFDNYVAFQILNAFCIVWIYVMLTKLVKDRRVLVPLLLFIPFAMYSTYIYGNLPGLALCLTGVYFLMGYLEKGSIKGGILSAVFMALGLWLKNSYQVIQIAVVVTLAIDAFREKAWFFKENIFASTGRVSTTAKKTNAGSKSHILKNLFVILMVVLLPMGTNAISDSILENRLGFSLGKGSPMLSWITMAFGEDERRNPVRYDAYNMHIYLDNAGNYQREEEIAREDLIARLRNLTDTPEHFLGFMGKKIARSWNDPSFESIAVNSKGTEVAKQPELIKNALKQRNYAFLEIYENLFHAVALLGIILYIIMTLREKDKELPEGELFLCLCFVGGFVFLLFWETLSQYALVYFLIMLPIAFKGYDGFTEALASALAKKAPEQDPVKDDQELTFEKSIPASSPLKGLMPILIPPAALVVLMAALYFIPISGVRALLRPNDESLLYGEMLGQILEEEAKNEGFLQDGRYVVSPAVMEGYGIAPLSSGWDEKDGEVSEIALLPIDDSNRGIINIVHEYNYDLLRIGKSQYLLTAEREALGEDEMRELQSSGMNPSIGVSQNGDIALWRILPAENGKYIISVFDNWCLTVAGNKPVIAPYEGLESQFWIIRRDCYDEQKYF